MMQLSAGVILTDGKEFLICHPTNSPYWDLPKGGLKPFETSLQACVRETLEETDYDLSNRTLTDLGLFKYTKRKKLHLYTITLDELPPLSYYKCNTYVTTDTGNKFLEMDQYMYVNLESAEKFLTPAMFIVLSQILKPDEK